MTTEQTEQEVIDEALDRAIQQIRKVKAILSKNSPSRDNEFWEEQLLFWQRCKAFWEATSQLSPGAALQSVTPLPEPRKTVNCIACGKPIRRGKTCSDRCRKNLSRILRRATKKA